MQSTIVCQWMKTDINALHVDIWILVHIPIYNIYFYILYLLPRNLSLALTTVNLRNISSIIECLNALVNNNKKKD